jgi:methyl-accepting chemotaxis protein
VSDKTKLTLVGPDTLLPRPPRSGGGRSATKRSVSNFMFQPVIQLKIAAYNALIAAVFSLVLALLFYKNLEMFANTFIDHTQADDVTINQVYHHIEGVRIWALLVLVGYVGVSIAVSLRITQKMVGSTVGFRRHIRAIANGDLSKRISVKRGDAFQDVAEELNYLTDALAKARESDQISTEHSTRRASGDRLGG